MEDKRHELIAYRIHNNPGRSFQIQPNVVKRDWIEQTPDRFAYRCLPLNLASSIGWSIPCPITFRAMYDGNRLELKTKPSKDGQGLDHYVADLFGHGIVTFTIDLMFRTPPGHNLFATGPINQAKRGISPLSGIIESDWIEATFTLNWMITELNYSVAFTKGEPIGTIFPYPRNYCESFDPVIKDLSTAPVLESNFRAWAAHRFTEAPDGHYMRGHHFTTPQKKFEAHQKFIKNKEFVET